MNRNNFNDIRKITVNLIKKVYNRIFEDNTLIIINPDCKTKGVILLSYIIAPFIVKGEYCRHSNFWECYQIVHTWLKKGYTVHIINYDDFKFMPKINYDFFIDIHNNLERLHHSMNKDCYNILHITNSHWLHQNYMEYSRLIELKRRKKKILIPRRIIDPCKGVEYANIATVLGNQVTIETYNNNNIEFFPLPVTSVITYPFNYLKNFQISKKNYLWLGSNGLVLKGLDLVIETFMDMPDYHLYICGPITDEEDFYELYQEGLQKCSNIHLIGWIDVTSEEFLKLLSNVIGIIFPSASEGQAGSVITAMHGGLIPIISKNCGVDVHNFGIILESLTIEAIKEAIIHVSRKNSSELFNMSKEVWEYARTYHTRERFSKEYDRFVDEVIKNKDMQISR